VHQDDRAVEFLIALPDDAIDQELRSLAGSTPSKLSSVQ